MSARIVASVFADVVWHNQRQRGRQIEVFVFGIESCLSNLKLKVVDDLAQHNLHRLLL